MPACAGSWRWYTVWPELNTRFPYRVIANPSGVKFRSVPSPYCRVAPGSGVPDPAITVDEPSDATRLTWLLAVTYALPCASVVMAHGELAPTLLALKARLQQALDAASDG